MSNPNPEEDKPHVDPACCYHRRSLPGGSVTSSPQSHTTAETAGRHAATCACGEPLASDLYGEACSKSCARDAATYLMLHYADGATRSSNNFDSSTEESRLACMWAQVREALS
jgi:hypothetical protein